jgi:hypothetical protein
MQENLIKGSFIHSVKSWKGEGKKLAWEKRRIDIEKGEGMEEKDWLGQVEGRSRE